MSIEFYSASACSEPYAAARSLSSGVATTWRHVLCTFLFTYISANTFDIIRLLLFRGLVVGVAKSKKQWLLVECVLWMHNINLSRDAWTHSAPLVSGATSYHLKTLCANVRGRCTVHTDQTPFYIKYSVTYRLGLRSVSSSKSRLHILRKKFGKRAFSVSLFRSPEAHCRSHAVHSTFDSSLLNSSNLADIQ